MRSLTQENVGHQRKGVHLDFGFKSGLPHDYDKSLPVLGVIHDLLFFNSPDHDLMQSSTALVAAYLMTSLPLSH
jgi:hypothetical protein